MMRSRTILVRKQKLRAARARQQEPWIMFGVHAFAILLAVIPPVVPGAIVFFTPGLLLSLYDIIFGLPTRRSSYAGGWHGQQERDGE